MATLTTRIFRSGNSLAVRIPRDLLPDDVPALVDTRSAPTEPARLTCGRRAASRPAVSAAAAATARAQVASLTTRSRCNSVQ